MASTSGRYGDNTTAYYLNREWTAAQTEAMPWGQTVIGGQFVSIASVDEIPGPGSTMPVTVPDTIPDPPSGTFVPPSSEYGAPTSSDGRWFWSSGKWWPNETVDTMPITTPTKDTTTGAPTMPQLPANLGTMTEAQKIAWYRATRAAGFTNEAIRAAVEARYGRQSDSDWTYLRAKAAQPATQTAAPAGGAGLLIAAAAAYFLLG